MSGVTLRCLVVDDDPLARLVLERFIGAEPDLELAGSCATAAEARLVLERDPPDLLFLDLDLPETSGVELLDSLETRPETILVTGTKDFAAEAFEAGVADYLVKPLSHARFLKALSRVRQRRGLRA